MNRLAWLMALALFLRPLPATAQTAAPPPAAEAKPGSISGRITAADTGKPLRRARVTITSTTPTGARPLVANTNAAGFFEAKAIPPGSYTVGAVRAGYLNVLYGQRRPTERGLTIDVRPAQAVGRIDLVLPRGGVLSGRITDELGEPYPGIRVDALATRYSLGRRVPVPAGSATTDDQGQFRVAGLAAGSYYVMASSPETWRTEKRETYGYATTYFPGGSVEQALLVPLATSQERTDLHFSLRAARTAHITGRLVRENGEPIAAARVSLGYRAGDYISSAGGRSVQTAGDGSFEFKDVAGGNFTLASAGVQEPITVDGADIDGVVLMVKTGSTVLGTFTTDTGASPPFPLSGVRVLLEAPTEKVLPTVRVVDIAADLSFRLTGLGGPFLFRVMGLPDGWMLGSVRLDDKDITDVPWDVPTGGKEFSGLTLAVTQKVGTVSGTVVDSAGRASTDATVVIFPDEADLWMPASRLIRVTRPSSDGRFSFTSLPAGTYRAIARESVEDGQFYDRAFLDAAREGAPRFVLREGGSESITLKLPSRQ